VDGSMMEGSHSELPIDFQVTTSFVSIADAMVCEILKRHGVDPGDVSGAPRPHHELKLQ
jgi:hypothetical protein